MHATAPTPPGDGAVMWWASALLAAPSTSPRIVAPRAPAVLPLLEHEHGGALAHHEPVAVGVERAARRPTVDSAVMLPKPAIDGRRAGRLGAAGDDRIAASPRRSGGRRNRRPEEEAMAIAASRVRDLGGGMSLAGRRARRLGGRPPAGGIMTSGSFEQALFAARRDEGAP